MKNYSAFDILGPIMVGPSSSHTAGAARLAKIASIIAGKNIESVNLFYMVLLLKLIKVMEQIEH